jgi:hypothetical protein
MLVRDVFHGFMLWLFQSTKPWRARCNVRHACTHVEFHQNLNSNLKTYTRWLRRSCCPILRNNKPIHEARPACQWECEHNSECKILEEFPAPLPSIHRSITTLHPRSYHTKLYKSSSLKSSLNPQHATSPSTMSSLNMQGVHITIH